MIKQLIFAIAILLLVSVPAVAAAGNADNNITVVKPDLSAGSYGTGSGQIDTPVGVKVDASDNIYILQHVYSNNVKFRSYVTVYDRNLKYVRSFPVLKKSMVEVSWERAPGNFYYDNLASAFDIGRDGMVYILCGWDVVVMDRNGTYEYQFPVQSFMGWIDKTRGDTQFYYPNGIAVTNDGYVAITSGDSPDDHEIILITREGTLLRKTQTAFGMQDIVRDRNGSLYVTKSGANVISRYDPSATEEQTMTLDFNGTYRGSPYSLAILSGGNITASANGIFIYNASGGMLAQFADNNRSWNNASWDRPIATNSTDWLIVVSGKGDMDKTPQPILLYKYDADKPPGAPEDNSIDFMSFGGALGIAAIAILAIVWLVGALIILKNRL